MAPLSLTENGAAAHTVELGNEPVAPVVICIRSDTPNPDVHAMPRLVRFSASD